MIGSFRLPISVTSSGDTTAPTITTATVEDANPDKLVVVFSEVVTITNTTGLTITGAATPTLSAPTGSGTNTITFTLSTALTNGQSVTLDVSSSNTIKDAANNSLAATTKAITNNVAAVSSYEAETTSYINRVNTDIGSVINEAYIDTVYSQLKADASLANLLFWIDYKGGMKKDASNFISKTYDLSSSLNDPIQSLGSKQPIFDSTIKFDGNDDSLDTPSVLDIPVGGTIYVRFIPEIFDKLILGKSGNASVYLKLHSSSEIRLQSNSFSFLSWQSLNITLNTEVDLFIQRSSDGYTLFLNGTSYGEKLVTGDFLTDLIGSYAVASRGLKGGIDRVALFNEILTPAKMNNLIAL